MTMTSNTIAYANEWADEARKGGASYDEARAAIQQRALADHPVYLGIVNGVNYDSKNDRYVVKFGTSSAKATNDAAAFLIQHAVSKGAIGQALPTVYAHITEGAIDAVLLLFIYRQ
jgi:hypothetical protein